MRAWSSPVVPTLDDLGTAPDPVLFDTATGTKGANPPQKSAPGPARMYVCGVTPYDATHIGHAATYVAFDLLSRAWRDAGRQVHYVQNVTDVDDPLLERAQATGEPWQELADREIELFRTDMEALRVLAPSALVGAVESIPIIVDLIDRLRDLGHAYDVDGDLYFSVHADSRFGRVAGLDEERMLELFPERGGDPDRPGKKHPLDCLLWRAERPDEPAWDSDLGRGRPGWHVECAAIALHHLGETFDVQGGGSDLAFPHHDMTASEAHAAREGRDFARSYVHAGMVGYDGAKMSKSKGNLVLVSDELASGTDPMALRLALLAHHYRSDWEWNDADRSGGKAILSAWGAAVEKPRGAPTGPVVERLRAALADDLDAPAACDVVHRWVEDPDESEAGAGDVIRRLVDARLGVTL